MTVHSSRTAQPLGAKPKILFIQTQAENAGAQEISRHVGMELEAKGYEVHHLFLYRKTDAFDGAPNTIFCADERPANPLELFALLRRLVKQIRLLSPDVVLTFQHYGNLIGAPAARLAGIKHIIANQVSAPATMNKLVRLLDKWFGALGMYDAITVNSADTAKEYAGFPKSYTRRITHIPHGFKDKTSALSKAEARRKFNLPASATLLGSVARLNPLKRLDVAIRLLEHDSNWHLVLGGHGPDRQNLEQLARDLAVADRVHFVGELESADVGDLLATMDIFVFPSEAETFGLAPVEAAQTGLPLVCNGLPVLREVLHTSLGPCSLFADSDTPESFVAPVKQLLSNADLAQSLIDAAYELKTIYSMDAMVDRYEGLIVGSDNTSYDLTKAAVA